MTPKDSALILSLFLLLAIAPSAHALTVGDIVGGISKAVSNVVNTVVNVATAVWNGITSTVSNIVSGSSKSNSNAGSVNGTNISTGKDNTKGDPINTGTGTGGTGNPTNTYKGPSKPAPIVSTQITETFSEITVSNLNVESVAPSGKFFSGMYWQVTMNLTNQGTAPGTTKLHYYMDCDTKNIFGSVTKSVRVRDQPVFTTAQIKPGSTEPYITAWWVDKSVLEYGGECSFKIDLTENVQVKKEIKTFIDGALAGLFGENYTKTGSFGGQVSLNQTTLIHVEPQFPQLEGGVGIGVGA